MSRTGMAKYKFLKSHDKIVLMDTAPNAKRSRAFHNSVGAAHIPEIDVAMKFTRDTEHLSVFLPENVFSRIPLLDGMPVRVREQTLKAGLDQETGERIELESPAAASLELPSLELPGSLWDLLILLKGVLEGPEELNGHALFLRGSDASALASTLKMAKHLQWQEAEDAISSWLRKRWCFYHPRTGTETEQDSAQQQQRHAYPEYLTLCKAMQALPDDKFSMPVHSSEEPGEMPAQSSAHAPPYASGGAAVHIIADTADALLLPPLLKVKWLRASAMHTLDLSHTENYLGTAAWQRLAACLHVVPSLEVLRLKLPVQPLPAPRKPPAPIFELRAPVHAQPNASPLRGYMCSVCERRGLHAHCNGCKKHVLVKPDPAATAKPAAAPVSTRTRQPVEDTAESDVPTASLAAIHTLHDVSTALPSLKWLDLCDSCFSRDHATAVSTALASFAGSLEQLTMHGAPLFVRGSSVYSATFVQGISQLLHLRSLHISAWHSIVGGHMHTHVTEMLASMPALAEVLVSEYPCQRCKSTGMNCPEHPKTLPFRQYGIDYSLIL